MSRPSGSASSRRALPVPPGPLVGRDAELAVLAHQLTDREVRLTTLTGPPGVGKTRLAVALAEAVATEFRDGAVFVDLTAVRDPDLVPGEIGGALGRDAGVATERLPLLLADRELLLVLDNFEHVLAAADVLGDLLAACPGLTVVVTSRERLHLRAEHEVPVLPLALPGRDEQADPDRLAASPAVALLVQRVRAFEPGFAVTDANREALAEICVRLDGLPLALELAAPRMRLFTPAELLFRLRHRVGSLASDARDVPDRHRTLHSALAWSHDLLGPDERVLFRQLSVFAGGWTMRAAERVCGVPDIQATAASLADKGLIRRVGDDVGAARFGMLESLREFAADLLERAEETAATKTRHADSFAELGASIEARIGTADEWTTLTEVGLDVANLRVALDHCLTTGRTTPALPLASALGWYCYTRGQLGAGQPALDATLAAAAASGDPPADAHAALILTAGVLAFGRGDIDRAERDIRRCLALNEQVGSPRRTAVATAFLGHVARTQGRHSDAVAHHEHAGRVHEGMGNRPGVAWSRYDLGLLARRRKDSDRAADHLRAGLAAFRDLGYSWAVACCGWALATVELARGRVEEATALLAEALGRFVAADDFRGVAQCLEAAAAVAAVRDLPDAAAQLLGAAGTLRDQLDAPLAEEEQGAPGAVRLRLHHTLGADPAGAAERSGRALSMPAALALADGVLAGRVGGSRPPIPEMAALTPREHEVALLVRQGRTNRQIGRQLGISEKTIEVHVHHIIGKLGAGSRAEIAAWVAARDSAP